MPSRNVIKSYVENGFYHIYNRGANKQAIFLMSDDYRAFLNYLKTYLTERKMDEMRLELMDISTSRGDCNRLKKLIALQNFYGRVEVLAYCLMPNHFHLLIKQKDAFCIAEFMRAVSNRYTAYFNRRYKKVGPLFQGKYKAVLVESPEQLLYLSKYIHRNPSKLSSSTIGRKRGITGQPSSYPVYLGTVKQSWVHPEYVLHKATKARIDNYQSFVEEYVQEDGLPIRELMIDEED